MFTTDSEGILKNPCIILIVLLLTVFALTSCEKDPEIIGIDAEKKMLKVDVCHYDADIDTWKTISINENTLKAHLKHGDTQGGRCGYTYVPDNAFEKWLIYVGYDTEMDDYVLTSNINTVEIVSFGEAHLAPPFYGYGLDTRILDLTGIEDFVELKRFYSNSHLEGILDLSNNKKLESIVIETTFATEFILPETPTLTYFYLTRSQYIKELDFSRIPNLSRIFIMYMDKLEKLDLKNGNTDNIGGFNVAENPMLDCIQVDDAEWATNNLINFPDNYWVNTFSEDCSY